MKTTIDTYSGLRFRWNDTVLFQCSDGSRWTVPARETSRTAEHLHPGRVVPALLAKLNGGRVWTGHRSTYDEDMRQLEARDSGWDMP